jgi:hypothetical protein
MAWAIGQKEGKVTLVLNSGQPHATFLIYEPLVINWPADMMKASGTFQVAGEAHTVSQVRESWDGVTLSQDYANGVATVTVAYCVCKIVDNGSKVQFANESYSLLGDGPKTIYVSRDSKGRVP